MEIMKEIADKCFRGEKAKCPECGAILEVQKDDSVTGWRIIAICLQCKWSGEWSSEEEEKYKGGLDNVQLPLF